MVDEEEEGQKEEEETPAGGLMVYTRRPCMDYQATWVPRAIAKFILTSGTGHGAIPLLNTHTPRDRLGM